MNKIKLIALIAVSLVALGGCKSKEEQRQEKIREDNQKIQKNIKEFKVESYGSGPTLYDGKNKPGDSKK